MEFVQFTEDPMKTRQGDRADCRARTEILATYILCWRRKMSGCSLQAVCQAETAKHVMVWLFLCVKRNRRLNDNIWCKLNQWVKTLLAT